MFNRCQYIQLIHLSLLPANRLEIASLQLFFVNKTTHLCTNINFQSVTVKRFSKKI
jgi:hypothetical protein